jgi:hypothetical protein
MRQKRRLIPARLGLGGQVARQQVRPIRLEQQPICWYFTHEGQQVSAATLVANPPGDADREVHLQVRRELVLRARKAVGDPAHECRTVLLHNRHKIGVGIALMQEDRLADYSRELQLAMECLLLYGARRQIAEIIEPAFAYRDHLRKYCKLPQLRQQLVRELFCMVRVYARGRKQPPRMSTSHLNSFTSTGSARASYHHLHHASGQRACNDRVTIGIEAVVSEIDTDIDQGSSYHV